jgi:cell wall-associated NlpC family hydrolase
MLDGPMSDASQFSGWDAGVLSREQVAQAAYEAGWRGEDLTKIVAIAYRESGGHFAVFVDRPSTGDWSYGLVGLNVGRPDASGQGEIWRGFYSKLGFLQSPDDLRDPVKNLKAAKALFDQSGWRPWGPYRGISETTGTDLTAAHAAVESASSHGLLGTDFDVGVRPLHPGDAAEAHPALQTFIHAALAQAGDQYNASITPKLDDPDPHAFDCSSLVQWAAHQAGVDLNRTAEAQYLQLKAMGSSISVEQALHTPGALLFHLPHEPSPGEAFGPNAHVAISLGDGRTIEAVGSKYGVREVDVASFHTGGSGFFTRAAVIPGLADGTATPLAPLPGTDAAALAHPAAPPPPPLPPRDDLPMPAAWRNAPIDAAIAHASTGHVVDLVALPPLPGVADHRADHAALAPLTDDPQHQPQPVAVPGHPAGTPDAAHPVVADPLHPAADPLHPASADAAHAAPTDPFAMTPADWAHGQPLPGELHHYDWASGHPLPGETHPDPHDPHQDPVHPDPHDPHHPDPGDWHHHAV